MINSAKLGLGTSSCIQAIVITERKRILLASTNLHTVGKNTHSWVVCVIMILRWRNIVSMYQCVTYSMGDVVKWRRRSEDNTLTGVLIHFASELETLRFSPYPYASYAVSHFGSFGSNGKLWCIIENYSQSTIISRRSWSTPAWEKQPWVKASMSLLEKCL